MITAPAPTVVRNIAVVGHSGAGKTTLVEAFLHRAGVIPRTGTIASGNTVMDHEPEEQARGISVSVGIAHAEWKSEGTAYQMTFLDTPGYPDFVAGVDEALSVADIALVVVSAVHGVQSGTEEVWRQCTELGIPRMVVVTKEDRPQANFHDVLAQVQRAFGPQVLALEWPAGEEGSLHGVGDLLEQAVFEYEDDGTRHVAPLHGTEFRREYAAHDALVEEIVTHDDDQLARYLAGDEPAVLELESTLAREVLELEAFPVLLCSGATGVGVDRVLDFLCVLAPSPAERPAPVVVVTTGEVLPVEANPEAEPLLMIFRTLVDPYVGQISVFKVLSGTVQAHDRLVNTQTGVTERLHGLLMLCGRDHDPVTQVTAGQIAAVAKLSASGTGTLLASRQRPVRAMERPQRPPVYFAALAPRTQADDEKLSAALARLRAEDATLQVDMTGNQAVLGGLGDTHLAVALERLARSFGVRVDMEPVGVNYQETISCSIAAEGKLKKQSGGHGQFAVVQLRVSPLPRGAGLEFVDSTVGGSIPRHYIGAVEKGIRDAMAAGGPQGYPVVDLRVEVYDGKSHAVDSSDMAFRLAASAGLREALKQAGSIILEPMTAMTVIVPGVCQGDVMGDISSRRGRITTTYTTPDGRAVVEAIVPDAHLVRYAMDVRSLTAGRATFTRSAAGFEPLPRDGSADHAYRKMGA